MSFEENPLPWLILITMAITWIVFPFVVMRRLKKIEQHLDRSEGRALAAYQAARREPHYEEQPAIDDRG